MACIHWKKDPIVNFSMEEYLQLEIVFLYKNALFKKWTDFCIELMTFLSKYS